MPYIIAVIALVIASVGFTLLQSSNTPVVTTPSEPLAVEQTTGTTTPVDAVPNTNTNTVPTAPANIPNIPTPSSDPKPTPTPTPSPTPAPTPKPTPTPTPAATTAYKNGTYKAQSSYRTPGGTYQMQVTVTVANDKVTAANVAFDGRGANDGYSSSFANSYQSKVVGQSLATVRPSRVGGASLTTNAFNNALNTIRTQATS